MSRFCQIESQVIVVLVTESGKLFDWERASREQVLPDRKSLGL